MTLSFVCHILSTRQRQRRNGTPALALLEFIHFCGSGRIYSNQLWSFARDYCKVERYNTLMNVLYTIARDIIDLLMVFIIQRHEAARPTEEILANPTLSVIRIK